MSTIKWVLLKKYCELTGDTRDGFKSKVARGKLAKGRHFKVVDNRTWVNIQEIDKMLDQSAA